MKKTALLLLTLFLATQAFAAPYKYEAPAPIVDSQLGRISFRLQDEKDDDIYEPLRLTVVVICKDNRTHPNQVKPRPTAIIADLPICDYRPYDWLADTHVLRLHYSTHEEQPGQATCNTHSFQDFELAEFCKPWNN